MFKIVKFQLFMHIGSNHVVVSAIGSKLVTTT
jgi:hypothetical protein